MEIIRMRLNNQPSLFRKWDPVALTDDYCSKALGCSWSRDRLIYKHLRTLLMNLFWSGLDQVTVLIWSSKKNLKVQTSACGPQVWSFGVVWVQPVDDQLTFVPKSQGFCLEHARDLGRKTYSICMIQTGCSWHRQLEIDEHDYLMRLPLFLFKNPLLTLFWSTLTPWMPYMDGLSKSPSSSDRSKKWKQLIQTHL